MNQFVKYFSLFLLFVFLFVCANCGSKAKIKKSESMTELISIHFPNKEILPFDLTGLTIKYNDEIGGLKDVVDKSGNLICMYGNSTEDLKRLRKEKRFEIHQQKNIKVFLKEIEALDANRDSINYLNFKFSPDSYFNHFIQLAAQIKKFNNLNFFANIDEDEMLVYFLPFKDRMRNENSKISKR